MSMIYAHSLPGQLSGRWEPLRLHAEAVARRAAVNAGAFGWALVAETAGRLHDIGKCSGEFQRYIQSEGAQIKGPDHATAGAVEAMSRYPGSLGRLLAFGIAGHHAGLADGVDLDLRLRKDLPVYAGWERYVGPLPVLAAFRPKPMRLSPHRGFSQSFLIRLLFSCLVDADFIETDRFYAEFEGRSADRDGFTALTELRHRLDSFMAAKQGAAPATPLNRLRAAILDHARSKASLPPGLFTMTVPTGGGKTLASLAFALAHAGMHDLRRVIYVVPFTSIIEQTAQVFREALGEASGRENMSDILEHHASFDWEEAARRQPRKDGKDGRGADPLDRLRRAAENWAAPVIVTTAVQFFESLFANRTSRCRKLHNLAKSVIVLDEAQTLPLPLLRPCMAALDELARNYGATFAPISRLFAG